MSDEAALAGSFEQERPRLRAVAYRMLGSAAEADDAVQEAWLRLSRNGADGIESLPAWLTTVVARLCLNMLRTRGTRREAPLDDALPEPVEEAADPEQEAVLAESVGLAMLVVLDTLAPAERVAFVLHDMFAVPFDEIARMTERTPTAARQLASRARRRVRGADPAAKEAEVARQRHVVQAFLAASRDGDFEALVAVLDPDVVIHADRTAGPTPEPVDIRGRLRVAQGASAAAARVAFTEPALLNGVPGLVMAPAGRLRLVLTFTVVDDLITAIDVIADPERLRGVHIEVL
ncbi:sigma-70 family RNA polymerase sigma factor [Streptomyces cocklensis]|jgi:RNA polymerase sigma-70 factor (ECF subfamily)|uniref:RNA polymerase sigma-70 factor, ECF subfamily n=1 Tax=Actinacidiphila cocklensis TaxID=887465 RepID=A0A9W4DLU5_9ACTN|nr:sigma-70 family RNA polymerase sigma factor [Actinacidiphila cocklensis]MDD1061629.1 sigma-70 family RNA polymerase sigma factor [Actinacidiphila cocklensis]WSX77667.1 sigma-70 family RNA polymerase sigma factor [Streptomyces sp. NBC_00899]CAG6392374.1 RNA polymerase sigma-70 factor, ECF subfamily [Actinacidiphila cocklensis]